ncbi:CYTH domain-containing protein [Candidatus Falkowbacteria bacterium]|nr:CYTH domain-containing protein [Candidatus Falkowbacteria bacterium]
MNIEYEATFFPVEKDEVRERLRLAGAELVRPEFMQKRVTFKFPEGHDIYGGWLRVRDEGDKVTMSLKVVDGDTITDQKEICLTVDSFGEAEKFLLTVGCTKKAYQETRRELWRLDGVEITIDEWPFIEPLVEVEGESETAVRHVSEQLGFDYSKALFCAVGYLYKLKYGVALDEINNRTPKITFEMENPFVKNRS